MKCNYISNLFPKFCQSKKKKKEETTPNQKKKKKATKPIHHKHSCLINLPLPTFLVGVLFNSTIKHSKASLLYSRDQSRAQSLNESLFSQAAQPRNCARYQRLSATDLLSKLSQGIFFFPSISCLLKTGITKLCLPQKRTCKTTLKINLCKCYKYYCDLWNNFLPEH